MSQEKIIIFDTTLRDGEQSPGATMNMQEKMLVAKLLEQMKVDIIEAGFPAASEGDFNAVSQIAKTIKDSSVCGLARAIKSDVEKAGLAVKPSWRGRIHTFISTSAIHLEYQMKKSEGEVLEMIRDTVSLARNLCDDVEWSAMDSTRSDKDFLFRTIETAINHGARTVNIPDTVGYAVPTEYHDLILSIKNNVPNIDKAIISVHCQNDLGLATANSLVALQAGARQVECTINGIGERAGNTALEEIVMSLKTRSNYYNFKTGIDTTLISRASKLVANITGFPVQYNKAIVGANAFAHESGIHQDGMLKNRNTYEIMTPESVGIESSLLVLGKHSGRAAFYDRLKEIGYELSTKELEEAFVKFKSLADKKKNILEDDIINLIDNTVIHSDKQYELISLGVSCGSHNLAKVSLKIKINEKEFGTTLNSKDGPVATIFSAIKKLIPHSADLDLYQVNAATGEIDAQAVVTVRLKNDNNIFTASGSDTDVLTASTLAYINCLEKLNKN